MEIYKTIKSVKTQSRLKKDYEISNKGNVRLHYYNEKYNIDRYYILELGKGLYISKKGYITAFHLSNYIYRLVYRLFIGEPHKGYQIHHKDFNKLNNDLNNLECLSPREHGDRHEWQGFDYNIDINIRQKYNKEINQFNYYTSLIYDYKINHEEYFNINSSKEYIHNIEKYLELLLKQKRLEIKETNKRRKEKIREDKLNSGNYILGKNNRLVRINYTLPKWTEERREKTLKSQQISWETTDRRQNLSRAVKKWYEENPSIK